MISNGEKKELINFIKKELIDEFNEWSEDNKSVDFLIFLDYSFNTIESSYCGTGTIDIYRDKINILFILAKSLFFDESLYKLLNPEN